jgi:hypothetical protein
MTRAFAWGWAVIAMLNVAYMNRDVATVCALLALTFAVLSLNDRPSWLRRRIDEAVDREQARREVER